MIAISIGHTVQQQEQQQNQQQQVQRETTTAAAEAAPVTPCVEKRDHNDYSVFQPKLGTCGASQSPPGGLLLNDRSNGTTSKLS